MPTAAKPLPRHKLDGWNLNDRRPPVSESELGDAQYYLLPARRLEMTLLWTFGS
jgi:hypothetical protein